jgi:hypothetical protein
MKKFLLGISIAMILIITSCKKEAVGCGEVIGMGDLDCSSGTCYYWLPIKFDDGHTDNKVYVDEATWFRFNMGDRICF